MFNSSFWSVIFWYSDGCPPLINIYSLGYMTGVATLRSISTQGRSKSVYVDSLFVKIVNSHQIIFGGFKK